jgi:hypothetical protein
MCYSIVICADLISDNFIWAFLDYQENLIDNTPITNPGEKTFLLAGLNQ